MFWQIPVSLRLVTAYVATPILIKKIVGLPSLKKNFCWQYLFCFSFSVVWALYFGFNLSQSVLILIFIGLANSLGAYAYWQATKISLSKTSLFMQADDLIGMFLGYLILGEVKFLNTGLIIGILLCFCAVGILTRKESNLALVKWVMIYGTIWGGVIFATRYFALEGMSFSQFLFGWYGGSFLGSLLILSFVPDLEESEEGGKKDTKETNKTRLFLGIASLAIAVWLSMVLGYWVMNLSPIAIAQPIFLVSKAVLPAIIGLWIFKEAATLTNREKFAYIVGIAGVLIIAFSYR